MNLQYLSDQGWGLYLYHPGIEPSAGFSVGLGLQGNYAWGGAGGVWTGWFGNQSFSAGPVGVGYFTGEYGAGGVPAWQGVSAGFSFGAPVGGASYTTIYEPLW